MKKFLPIAALLVSANAVAAPLSVTHDVIACVKKPARGYATSWELVMLKKNENVVVYQNSSNGNEKDPITSMGVVGTKLIVQHNRGAKETVTFDLAKGNATWVEDEYPNNTQLYSDCKSFAVYDFATIRAWFASIVETAEWRNR